MARLKAGNERDHGSLKAADGTVVPVRSIHPDDAPALKRFYDRLSERTFFLRFFGAKHELTDEQARYLTHLDGEDRFALVALDPQRPEEIVAIVRYERDQQGAWAEYAALIEDRWQERGLGLDLTRELVEAARDRKIEVLYAHVMADNTRMINTFRDLGLPERVHREEDRTELVEIELKQSATLAEIELAEPGAAQEESQRRRQAPA